uniref:DNA mismatch repair proteins mutS family domain-containing protein n=1 Tax=Tetradesmus obliquus TaxID=3088 RepID=A0A383W7S3_TETOB|eukprot:jgi/Sobl393_1/770/SZX73695.1
MVPYVGLQEQQQYLQQQQQQQQLGSRGVFYLKGLWPFWMVGSDSSTIKNDVALDGFMLLTGPNMAGKSTVLRAVAAAALCGCVGLAVPAAPGSTLPCLDAVVLRTFSGDAPQEGLSAFAVEMKEMTYVLSEVRPHSLVLVDELGKGTEAVWGTALAAEILQTLAASGASGIFATHLHLLLPLLERQQQQQQQPSGPAPWAAKRLEPTMRLEPGACTESLTLEVAEQQGMPASVLNQAARFFAALQELAATGNLGASQALVQAAASSTRWSSSSSSIGDGSSLPASSSSSSSSAPSAQQQDPAIRQQQQQAGAVVEAAAAAVAQPGRSRRGRRRRASSATKKQDG